MEPNHAALQAELQDIDNAAGAMLGQSAGEGGAQTPAADEAAPPAPANNPEYVAGSLRLAVGMLAPMFPSLRLVYTDQAVDEVAKATAVLADKYGWDLSLLLGRWEPEIKFGLAVWPLAIGTYQAVKFDLEARQASKDGKEPQEEPGKRAEHVSQ